MTTLWKPAGEWSGATVAVLGAGPSLTKKAVDSLKGHRTIACNFAIRLAPDADMLLALDGNWPQEFRDFAGMRVTGCADDTLDALYMGPQSERLMIAPGHEVEITFTGLAALRLAAAMGAKKIIYAGFDPDEPRYFYDDEVDTGLTYLHLGLGLQKVIADLTAQGVKVEQYKPKAYKQDADV